MANNQLIADCASLVIWRWVDENFPNLPEPVRKELEIWVGNMTDIDGLEAHIRTLLKENG